jgi:hypothetical protein
MVGVTWLLRSDWHSVVKIFDLTVGSTGLNSRQLKEAQIPFERA